MAVLTKAGTFFRPANPANPTVVTGLGFKPNGIIFFATSALASGTAVNTFESHVLGAALGNIRDEPQTIRTHGEYMYATDAATPGVTELPNGSTAHLDLGAGLYWGFKGSTNQSAMSFDADGFTVEWHASQTALAGQMVSYLAFGGDADARIIYGQPFFGSPPALNSEFTLTFDPSFWPTGALVWADIDGIATDDPEGEGDALQGSSFGAAANRSGETQWVRSLGGQARYGSTVAKQRISSDRAIRLLAEDGSVMFGAQIVRWGKGFVTFKVTERNPPAFLTLDIGMMALGGASVDVGILNKATGASGSVQNVLTAQRARGVVLDGIAHTATDTTGNDIRHTFGVSDGTIHAARSVMFRNAQAVTDASLIHRNDRAYMSAAGTPQSQPDQATAAMARDRYSLTWNPNTANAYRVGWLAFIEGTRLEAAITGQSFFHPLKAGSPVRLAATIAALSDFYPQTFGTVGNIAPALMASQSGFAPLGIGFDRPLSALFDAYSDLSISGLSMNHPLAVIFAGLSNFLPIKPGTPAPLSQVAMVSESNFAPLGITFDRPLSSVFAALSAFESRFRITIPTIRDSGPDDLPGTVNWHPNPSAERDLVGWFTEGAGPEIERTTDLPAFDGAWSVRRETTADSAGQGVAARSFAGLELTGYDADGLMRRVNGQARVYSPLPDTLSVWTRARYTDGTTIDGEAQEVAVGPGWGRYLAPAIVLDPARVLNYVETIIATPVAQVSTFYVDAAQLEEDRGHGATAWAIGSYGKEAGQWDGVPHVSMTTRQPIPMIIRGTGDGGEIIVDLKMYRATWDNQFVEDISDMVINASVTMDAEREVTWSMDANFTWEGYQDLEENFDWLAPVMTLTYPNGATKRGQLGLYFLVPGAATRGEFERSVQVSAFDPLWLLARQAFTGPLRVGANEKRIRVLKDILDGAVLSGGDDTGVPRRYAGPDSNKVWKKRREWPRKTERLPLANEILESTAMYPLWSNARGEWKWRKRGEGRMMDRQPVRAWAANLPPGVSIDARIPRVASLKSEVVGAIKTTPLAHDAFDEILIINDDPSNKRVRVRGRVKGKRKHKRVVRGRGDRKRVRSLYAPLVDDEATAQEIAAALTDELSNRTELVEMSVLPDPSVDYCRETVVLHVSDAYGDPVAVGQYEVLSVTWELQFAPSLNVLQKMRLAHVDNGDAEIETEIE